MKHKGEGRPSTPNPIERAKTMEWLRQAIEDGDPPGMVECWQCGKWRPDPGQNEGAENCPHCAAAYVPF